MSSWGRKTYGDPCRECGFVWNTSLDDIRRLIAAAPEQYRQALAGLDGRQRAPELGWTAAGYVCHAADNLYIWSERLAGAVLGDATTIVPYDPDLLGTARGYNDIATEAALWSLGQAAREWEDTISLAEESDVTLDHPKQGPHTALDVARTNAHDTVHHLWDVTRCVKNSH